MWRPYLCLPDAKYHYTKFQFDTGVGSKTSQVNLNFGPYPSLTPYILQV